MPQLMPLNWIFSSMMITIVMISGCMIYSEMVKSMEMKELKEVSKMKMMWFW